MTAAPGDGPGGRLPAGTGGSPAEPPAPESLRAVSLAGAMRLMVREGGGILIRLVGVVVVTRQIGTADYGVFVGCSAFIALLATASQQGVEVYLISRADEPSERDYSLATTFLLVAAVLAMAVGLAGSFVVAAVAHRDDYLLPFRVLLVSIPLNILWAPAQARLERAFDYRRLGFLELSGDLVLYLVSVPLAALGAGVWAPAAGYVAWQAYLLAGSWRLARLRPALCWSRRGFLGILRFSGGYSAGTLVASAADLISPVVIGRYLGSSGVGLVALALRLVDTVSFVLRAVWRLALVALSRVQDDTARLRRGVEEGMALQVALVGPIYALLAIVATFGVRLLFGRQWVGAVEMVPYFSVSYLVGNLFLIPGALLRTRGRNAPAFVGQVLHLVLVLGAAELLVPRLGLQGYGLAVLIGLLGNLAIDRAARSLVPYNYRNAAIWLAVFAPVMFVETATPVVGALLFVPLVVAACVPAARRQARGYVREAWRAVGPRRAATGPTA